MTSVCGSPCPLMLFFPFWSLSPVVSSVVSLGMVIGVHRLGGSVGMALL